MGGHFQQSIDANLEEGSAAELKQLFDAKLLI